MMCSAKIFDSTTPMVNEIPSIATNPFSMMYFCNEGGAMMEKSLPSPFSVIE